MKYKIPAVLALVVVSVAMAVAQTSTSTTNPTPAVTGASFSFTAINFPGATRTRANGLNDLGDIVGDYIDPPMCAMGISCTREALQTLIRQGRL